MKPIIGWFLRWLTGWADIIDGVCWVCTFGLWRPDASLQAEKAWLDWVESHTANEQVRRDSAAPGGTHGH